MSNDREPEPGAKYYYQYYPDGVKKVLASGTYAWIGLVDDTTVLKYPLSPDRNHEDRPRLEAEKKLLAIVTPHERIIGFKGATDDGIYLERAPHGTVAQYLLESGAPPPSTRVRLRWCREAAEAVAWIHGRRVLHCDIQPTNLLLDAGLHVKLADFQGRHLAEDGAVLVDGWSGEPARYSCPRPDICDADVKTDLFALGCTIYFIMTGHEVYPDIAYGAEGWHEAVEGRFARGEFPEDPHACSAITAKCWRRAYESADEVVRDLRAVEESIGSSSQSGTSTRPSEEDV